MRTHLRQAPLIIADRKKTSIRAASSCLFPLPSHMEVNKIHNTVYSWNRANRNRRGSKGHIPVMTQWEDDENIEVKLAYADDNIAVLDRFGRVRAGSGGQVAGRATNACSGDKTYGGSQPGVFPSGNTDASNGMPSVSCMNSRRRSMRCQQSG